MINFDRSGNKVRASIQYKSGDVDTSLYFYWECGHEITAESLSRQLQDFHDRTVEREVKTAYEAGYKAGKQRKTKRNWFHTYLTHINESLQDWKKD